MLEFPVIYAQKSVSERSRGLWCRNKAIAVAACVGLLPPSIALLALGAVLRLVPAYISGSLSRRKRPS